MFVEYNTISVDEDDRLVIGRDPYDYDTALLKSERPIEEI